MSTSNIELKDGKFNMIDLSKPAVIQRDDAAPPRVELTLARAWLFRRWWSAKVELVDERPNSSEGEVTPLYDMGQIRKMIADGTLKS